MKIFVVTFVAFVAIVQVQALGLNKKKNKTSNVCTTCSDILGVLGSLLTSNQQLARDEIVHPIRKISDSASAPVQPRIVGGAEVVAHSIPWQVGVYSTKGQYLYFCGGSLISNTYVMTAAHCVDGVSNSTVVLGAHNIFNKSESTRVTIPSNQYIVHQGWNSLTLANDIALIIMSTPVTLNDVIKTVQLPSRTDSCDSFSGDTATVSGWGITSDASETISPTLMAVSNPVITNLNCALTYGPIITAKHICMSGAGVKSSCSGDSGGPMMAVGASGSPVQVGIVSFGKSTCESSYPQGYTRVGCYLDWLATNAGVTIAN